MFQRTQSISLSPIKTIELLASKIPDVVSLAQGIPSFDTPGIVKRAVIKALNRGVVAKYSLTYGLPELRETIEQKLAEDGMYYDFETEIIVVAGSIEGITATLITIIEPGTKDEVIIFTPDYTSYAEAVRVAGGKPVYVNLIEESADFKNKNLKSKKERKDKGWRIDFDDLTQKINYRTAAILFSNPNNPTGTIFSKEELIKIAEIIKDENIFAISDEVYKDFIYTDTDYPTPPFFLNKNKKSKLFVNDLDSETAFFSLAQLPELRKKVIRVYSLSKTYAMAGWRIGFLHSDEELIKEIVKVHDSLVTCAPVVSQYAALAALDFASNDVDIFRYEFQRRRGLICKYLDELNDFFAYQKPKGSYFIFPKISETALNIAQKKRQIFQKNDQIDKRLLSSPSWLFALDLLYTAKVAVVPGVAFGPAGENHIRISFGRSKKDIDKAMKRIKEYLYEKRSNKLG